MISTSLSPQKVLVQLGTCYLHALDFKAMMSQRRQCQLTPLAKGWAFQVITVHACLVIEIIQNLSFFHFKIAIFNLATMDKFLVPNSSVHMQYISFLCSLVYGADCSPGPRYLMEEKITRFGKDGTPAYSILGRGKNLGKQSVVMYMSNLLAIIKMEIQKSTLKSDTLS